MGITDYEGPYVLPTMDTRNQNGLAAPLVTYGVFTYHVCLLGQTACPSFVTEYCIRISPPHLSLANFSRAGEVLYCYIAKTPVGFSHPVFAPCLMPAGVTYVMTTLWVLLRSDVVPGWDALGIFAVALCLPLTFDSLLGHLFFSSNDQICSAAVPICMYSILCQSL